MHLAFGIPADIFVYPILSEDKKYKEQSLAAALEERIVKGLGDRGWSALGANLASRPLVGDLPVLIRDRNSDRFLLITLQNWFVSVNTNWVTAFNFDWAVRVEVFDRGGASILNYEDAGRDVVDVAYNESYGNHIRLAYKERLSKILEDARLRDALAN